MYACMNVCIIRMCAGVNSYVFQQYLRPDQSTYVCVLCMNVCILQIADVCMHVSMYSSRIYACIYVCIPYISACMNVCILYMCASRNVCRMRSMYVCKYECMQNAFYILYVCMYECMYSTFSRQTRVLYVCMYECMYSTFSTQTMNVCIIHSVDKLCILHLVDKILHLIDKLGR